MLTKSQHLFDDATRIMAGDSRWQGRTSPDYWAFVGPFGGITAATILRALVEHPQCPRPVVAHRQLLRADCGRRLRSRSSPGQGQPFDPTLVRGAVARRRRAGNAGDRGVCRAPPVMVAAAAEDAGGQAVRGA